MVAHKLYRLAADSRVALLCIGILLVTGCTRQVTLREKFPVPVMEKLPVAVSLYISQEMRNHVHSEELKNAADWKVKFGDANTVLFRQMFKGMFAEVRDASQPKPLPGTAALLIPKMLAFQFSTPEQSASDYFEVWIKYSVALHDRQGKQLLDWPFTAYGRNRSEFMGGSDAMIEATRRAMRDAAAAVVVDFMKQPQVKAYFSAQAVASEKGKQ